MKITCPECESSKVGRAIHRAAGRCLVDKELCRMSAAGATREEMGVRLGVTAETIGRHLRRLGLTSGARNAPPARPNVDATIWSMREAGDPFESIAAHLGMTKGAVEKRHGRIRKQLANPATRAAALKRISAEPYEPSRPMPKRSTEEKVRSYAEQLIADGWPEHQAWSRARECYVPAGREAA